MDKLKLVAKHEFWKLVKSKSFIIMTLVIILLPLLGGIVLGGIAYMSGLASSDKVGYVDNSGIIGDVWDVSFFRFDSEESAIRALAAKEISGYYVITEDYMESGKIYWYSFEGSLLTEASRVFSEGKIRESLVRGVTQDYIPPAVVDRVSKPTDVQVVTLDTSGVPTETQGTQESMVFGLVLGFVFIMVVMSPSGYLLTGLMREKENKVMEILLSSVSPRQLLMGKVAGIGMAGLLQVLVIGAGELVLLGLAATVLGGFMAMDAGTLTALTTGVAGDVGLEVAGIQLFPQGIWVFLGMGIIYFLLGYLLYTMLLTVVGAICNVEQQASQWQAPLLFICALPLFVSLIWMGNPNNAVMVGMSLFPLTAPLSMIIRLSCTVVPLWQIVASTGIMALTIGVAFWLMPKLFRGDVLLSGRSFSLKRLLGLRGIAK